jgi:hypothetical protein
VIVQEEEVVVLLCGFNIHTQPIEPISTSSFGLIRVNEKNHVLAKEHHPLSILQSAVYLYELLSSDVNIFNVLSEYHVPTKTFGNKNGCPIGPLNDNKDGELNVNVNDGTWV